MHQKIATVALVLVPFLVVTPGCFESRGTAPILDEAPDADGLEGLRGPFGVERAYLSRAGVDVEVTLPVGEGAHQTPVIVVQGGGVVKERYRWLTEHLTTRGFTVLNTQHVFDFAIFDVDASLRALEAVKADPQFAGRIANVPAVAIGHSLGGVIAAKIWNQAGPDVIQHLILLASLPDEADSFPPNGERIVFSISGTRNGRTTSQEFFDGSRAFVDAAEVYVVTIEGMNHYQFVSDPTDDELANDGAATIDIEVAQQTALSLIDRLCDDAAGTRDFEVPPDFPWPGGVETFED
ncbi:MAG: hypothetical protein GY822_26005 [Deltaproteobacteria bacterium]|nr:hypothetical protein [Deltaproteobacteria bacterium]